MTKRQAQDTYRAAWLERATCVVPSRRAELERVMDAVQPDCVDFGRPGPEWEAFVATLPGFREEWDRIAAEAREMITRLKEKLR